MRITITIPDGRCCEDCHFKISKQCAYLRGKHLATGGEGEIKDDECPAKKY
jgi:hypothetical protein